MMQRCNFEPYEGNAPYIFISYAHADRDIVFPILERMNAEGFRLWYDVGIEWGTEWPDVIAQHINDCNTCLCILSKNSIKSKNCRDEINFAINNHKNIIALYIEEVVLPSGLELRLSTYQSSFYYQYEDKDAFFARFTSIPSMKCCINTNTSPSFADKPSYAQAEPQPAVAGDWKARAQNMLKRACKFIKIGEFAKADELLDELESMLIEKMGDCTVAFVYHYKLYVEYRVKNDEALISALAAEGKDILENTNYILALECAKDDEQQLDELTTLRKIKADLDSLNHKDNIPTAQKSAPQPVAQNSVRPKGNEVVMKKAQKPAPDTPRKEFNISGTTLSKFIGSSREIVIPEGIEEIGESAFAKCDKITSIYIPSSVKTIGMYAFRRCTSLTQIIIPDSVETLGGYAFNECTSLVEAYIGSGVSLIAQNMFYGCSSLHTVGISKGVTSIADAAFYGCSALTKVVIPDGVTFIGEGAFCGCSALEDIYIPDGVEDIKNSAFERCTSFKRIILPNSVATLGDGAFYDCSGLEEIDMKDGVEVIGSYTFFGCKNLKSINIPDIVESVGEKAFYGCENLGKVIIGAGVCAIGRDAFTLCQSLYEVTFVSTENWYRTQKAENAKSKSGGFMVEVIDATANARYLSNTFSRQYWYKGEV